MANPLLQDDGTTSVKFWGTPQMLRYFNVPAMGTERRQNGQGPWPPFDCLGGAEGLVFGLGSGSTDHEAETTDLDAAAD